MVEFPDCLNFTDAFLHRDLDAEPAGRIGWRFVVRESSHGPPGGCTNRDSAGSRTADQCYGVGSRATMADRSAAVPGKRDYLRRARGSVAMPPRTRRVRHGMEPARDPGGRRYRGDEGMLQRWETRIRSRDDKQRRPSVFDYVAGAQVVQAAVSTIEGCDAAGLFTVADEAVMTNAWTDDAIVELDQVQFELDEGPCLDAVCEGFAYWAHDLAFDPRWPTFRVRALEFGLRSTLAVPLSVPAICALALYSRTPGVFNDVVRAQSSRFATNATAALIPFSVRREITR